MDLIREYALAFIAGLSGIGIIGTLINLFKAFGQKSLNKSFDLFRNSVVSNDSSSKSLAETINNLSSDVKKLLEDIHTAVAEIEELKEIIALLQSDSLLTEIKDGLLEMSIVKQSIDMKDALLDTFGKEVTKIKAELEKINRRGE